VSCFTLPLSKFPAFRSPAGQRDRRGDAAPCAAILHYARDRGQGRLYRAPLLGRRGRHARRAQARYGLDGPGWHHNYASLGWLGGLPAPVELHYPPIKPELVGLIDALHGIAHEGERRAEYLADRAAYAGTLPADPGSARCARCPRPPGDRRNGHPPAPAVPRPHASGPVRTMTRENHPRRHRVAGGRPLVGQERLADSGNVARAVQMREESGRRPEQSNRRARAPAEDR
jgi:hypothetical protein